MSLFTAIQFGPNLYCIVALIFLYALIALLFIDLDTMLLPDQITLPLMWMGILLSMLEISPTSLQNSVLGAVFGYLSLWSVYWIFKLATGKEGMGYGDFKLLAVLGAWLGWQYLPMIILCSSIAGAFIGIVQLSFKGQALNQAFPFGPYLAISGWVALVWGDEILNWYMAQFWGV
jgi:leader peptidase (prepilin peptidase)/N-methyltransferase